MNKKQIIKILEKEVGFLDITEDENELGELYISDAQFKEIKLLITEFNRRKEELQERIKFYKKKILSNEGGVFIHKEVKELVKDKTINIKGDFIVFDCKRMMFISNHFNKTRLNLTEKE